MDVTAVQSKVDASLIAPEKLAGNTALTKEQKIAEASRQFEAVLLRQILENTQKTVIHSKYTDDSMSSAIYRDQITSQLADSISKSGSFGFAKVFEQQLTQRTAENSANTHLKSEPKPDSTPANSHAPHAGHPVRATLFHSPKS